MSVYKEIELNRIKQVAREYQSKGYTVSIEPTKNAIPDFLDWYRPDIIAKNDREIVIIEVKSREDYKSLERLSPIIDRVNKTEGWRFELVIVNRKQELKNIETTHEELDDVEIRGRFNRINDLIKKGFFEAALLLNWALFESVGRRIMREDRGDISLAPLSLIKTLFSYGHMNKNDYNFLIKLFQLRNVLVHGYKTKRLPKAHVIKFLQITQEMFKKDNERSSGDNKSLHD